MKMNDQLKSFARKVLKEDLSKCTEKQQLFFKRMYSHDNLNILINDVVDLIPEEKLDWAMRQVEQTLRKNETKEENK